MSSDAQRRVLLFHVVPAYGSKPDCTSMSSACELNGSYALEPGIPRSEFHRGFANPIRIVSSERHQDVSRVGITFTSKSIEGTK